MRPSRRHPDPRERLSHGRGTTAIDGAIGIIVILVVIQMWIVTASLESYLGGHDAPALAAAIVSGLVLAACIGLYVFIRRVDREARGRSEAPRGPSGDDA